MNISRSIGYIIWWNVNIYDLTKVLNSITRKHEGVKIKLHLEINLEIY